MKYAARALNLRRLGTSLLLIAGVGAPAAFASSVTYTINFTVTSESGGDSTPTGSFTYNNSGAPEFTDFTVTFGGATIDLATAADNPNINSPAPCESGFSGAPLTFALLQDACQPPDSNYWGTITSPEVFYMTFGDDVASIFSGPGPDISANGYWSLTEVTPSQVPEPSTLIPASLFCLFVARKQMGHSIRG
jgi:hypothetical protein